MDSKFKYLKYKNKYLQLKKIMKGGNETHIENNIYFSHFTIGKTEDVDIKNKFITMYIKDKDNICINKKTNEKTQNLEDVATIDPETNEFIFTVNDKIIMFLYNKNSEEDETLLSFAVINPGIYGTHNIIIIDLLCSHRDSNNYKINEQSVGKFLLDKIYEDYITAVPGNILKIQPATPELISYYVSWKQPNFDQLKLSHGYLLYCNINSVSDDTLRQIFKDHIDALDIASNLIKNIYKIEITKNFKSLLDKDKKSYLSLLIITKPENSIKEQIINRINTHMTIEEIKGLFH